MTELISIIMPAYNASKCIEQAIESVLAQTHTNFELIIVDDGSQDETWDVITSYANSDERIRAIQHESNKGPSAARNTGLSMAQGSWLAFIDSDDVWEPSRLGEFVSLVNRVSSDCFVADNMLICTGNDTLEPIRTMIDWNVVGERPNDHVIMDFGKYLSLGAPVIQPMIPRKSIENANLRFNVSARVGEDLELYAKLFLAGYQLALINKPLYKYRVNKDSLTHQLDDLEDLLKVYKNILELPGLTLEEQKVIHKLYNKERQRQEVKRAISLARNGKALETCRYLISKPSVLLSALKLVLDKVLSRV